MKKEPRQPLARSELVAQLRSFDCDPVIERYRKDHLTWRSPIELLQDFTMGPSICRAFPHEAALQRYRQWPWYSRADRLIEELGAIADQDAFDRFAMELGKSLVANWGARNALGKPSKMNAGVAMKIVNIALKHLSFSDSKRNPGLIQWLHVPWDKFTLTPLRKTWRGHPVIPCSPSMGFVKDLATYQQLHSLISGIAHEAGVARIIYEFWAWDDRHQ